MITNASDACRLFSVKKKREREKGTSHDTGMSVSTALLQISEKQ
jgi:hypothetical protein